MKRLFALVVLLTTMLLSQSAQADDFGPPGPFRLGVQVGFGMLIVGDKHPSGGFALLGGGVIGYRGGEDTTTWTLAYRNSAYLSTFRSLQGIGIYDMHALEIGWAPSKHFSIEAGPALGTYFMTICSNSDQCTKLGGWAPGGVLNVNGYITEHHGIILEGHVAYMKTPLWTGPITTIHAGYQVTFF